MYIIALIGLLLDKQRESLTAFSQSFTRVVFTNAQDIVTQGENIDRFYLIVSGSVEFSLDNKVKT